MPPIQVAVSPLTPLYRAFHGATKQMRYTHEDGCPCYRDAAPPTDCVCWVAPMMDDILQALERANETFKRFCGE